MQGITNSSLYYSNREKEINIIAGGSL